MGQVDDQTRLLLLENCLHPFLQKELRFAKEDGIITFHEFLATLEARFGDCGDEFARKSWEAVKLPQSGKIRLEDLRNFEVDFKAGWKKRPNCIRA